MVISNYNNGNGDHSSFTNDEAPQRPSVVIIGCTSLCGSYDHLTSKFWVAVSAACQVLLWLGETFWMLWQAVCHCYDDARCIVRPWLVHWHARFLSPFKIIPKMILRLAGQGNGGCFDRSSRPIKPWRWLMKILSPGGKMLTDSWLPCELLRRNYQRAKPSAGDMS